MRSGRGDEDVDREVAVEPVETLEGLRLQRRLALARLEDAADERRELVAPREAVVADAIFLACGQDGHGGIALEARRLALDAERQLSGEGAQLRDDAFCLCGEVDVARAGKRSLLRPVRDEELDGPLERIEKLANLCLLLWSEDRHLTTITAGRRSPPRRSTRSVADGASAVQAEVAELRLDA